MATLGGETTSATAGNNFGSSGTSDSGFSWDNISGEVLSKFIGVMEGLLILVAAYFITRLIKAKFAKMEAVHDNQRTALNLLEKVINGFTIVIGITLALKMVGLDVSLIVSVCLLGLSYGLKDMMKNYVAGILIFFKSPFKIGDIVKIKGYMGKVEKMDLQAITVKTFDNKEITIYNSDIMIQSVANYSRYPMRRLEIIVKLGYGTDVNKAMRIFNTILKNETKVLKSPKFSIMFKKFTETSMDVMMRFWVQMPANILAIRTSLAGQIQQAFDEASLYIPYGRSIEMDSDYTMTDERKTHINSFYDLPIFAAPTTPPATTNPQAQTTPQATNEPALEFIDADEPEE